MGNAEQIELAKAYVALSNAHRIELISPMLAASAVYESDNVGRHAGRDAILAMMRDFFDRYDGARWDIVDYQCIERDKVSFEFIMTATEVESAQHIERVGIETIEFDERGFISGIGVASQE